MNCTTLFEGKFVILASVSTFFFLLYFDSLNINSWEWAFGNQLKCYLSNLEGVLFMRRRKNKKKSKAKWDFYAAYKNTTGDNKIFKVVFNGDGKSKQSWLTFGFL